MVLIVLMLGSLLNHGSCGPNGCGLFNRIERGEVFSGRVADKSADRREVRKERRHSRGRVLFGRGGCLAQSEHIGAFW